jgi:hypothetical protein
MEQKITNNSPIDKQIIAAGSIYLSKKSRYAKRFEKLKSEFDNNERYQEVIEELEYYLTKLDGLNLEKKLTDGGFNEKEIIKASKRKELYWKKYEKYKYYESAQKIDNDLFAKIKIDFETYIDPLIEAGEDKTKIMKIVLEKVVNPILILLNEEGEEDELLNYNAEEIYGMIYHLTGNCHLYWANYDNI